jgi:hypothetical protein
MVNSIVFGSDSDPGAVASEFLVVVWGRFRNVEVFRAGVESVQRDCGSYRYCTQTL